MIMRKTQYHSPPSEGGPDIPLRDPLDIYQKQNKRCAREIYEKEKLEKVKENKLLVK